MAKVTAAVVMMVIVELQYLERGCANTGKKNCPIYIIVQSTHLHLHLRLVYHTFANLHLPITFGFPITITITMATAAHEFA